jgi:hypothetical protein
MHGQKHVTQPEAAVIESGLDSMDDERNQPAANRTGALTVAAVVEAVAEPGGPGGDGSLRLHREGGRGATGRGGLVVRGRDAHGNARCRRRGRGLLRLRDRVHGRSLVGRTTARTRGRNRLALRTGNESSEGVLSERWCALSSQSSRVFIGEF